jgi:preprotein translocase subunit SecF
MQLPNPYAGKRYKLLAVIPIAFLLAAAFLVFFKGLDTGIDLRGGLLITIQTDKSVDANLLKERLGAFSASVGVREFVSPAGTGVEIELENNPSLEKASGYLSELHDLNTQLTQEEIRRLGTNDSRVINEANKKIGELSASIREKTGLLLKELGSSKPVPDDAAQAVALAEQEFDSARSGYRDRILNEVRTVVDFKEYSYKEVGSSLSRFFLQETQRIVLLAFILSAIAIFIVFRSIVPSFAVMFGAFSDIFITLGFMSLFDIELSLASVAALLMLIGFSLDTDVLLTVRVMKRTEDTPQKRAYGAMRTGFLMNCTAIGSFSVLALFGYLLQVPTYTDIGIVVVIGAFVDFVATWCANAVLILNYVEKKSRPRVF